MAEYTYPTVTGSSEGGLARHMGDSWPPTGLADYTADSSGVLVSYQGTHWNYTNGVFVVRFNTTGMPTPASARLRFMVNGSIYNTDGKTLLADYVPSSLWPLDASCYSFPLAGTAGSMPVSSIVQDDITLPGYHAGWNEITLANLNQLNPSGYTCIRFGLSDGTPTGANWVPVIGQGGSVPPWTDYPSIIVTSGYAHKVNGILPANIASINGVPTANIAKFKGV